jgi:prephenate dehydratase
MNDPLQIAFQGEPGAYSEEAALEYFGPGVKTTPQNSFEQVFSRVNEGDCDYGLIPIENSLAGSIHRNYDLMLRHALHITGEYHLRVSHCLLALPGIQLGDIRRVHSHPQALAQCESRLEELGLEPVVETDTAGSARLLREWNDRQAAALASRRAAEVYGLDILIDHMEDNPANFTRFLAISRQPLEPEELLEKAGRTFPAVQNEEGFESTVEYKTSVVFSMDNRPGALFKALSVFALREIDLTKIESRPIAGKPWNYMFYIDFTGHAKNPVCRRALEHLQEIATFWRLLGSYPRHRLEYSSE